MHRRCDTSDTGKRAHDADRYDVYRVADASADGLRAQMEFQPDPCLSLAAAGMPVVRTLVVHNQTSTTLADITVEGRFLFGQSGDATFTTNVQGPHTPSSAVDIPLGEVCRPATIAAFQQSAEAVSGSIQVRVTARPEPADAAATISVEINQVVHVLPGNQMLNWPSLLAALATFSRPNTRSLTPVLRAASDLLRQRTGSGALDGYQEGAPRAQRIAGALYEAVRGRGITYINPPASFEHTGQKVRTVDQVLSDRFGTCIDLTCLYASALEAAGLRPLMFLSQDHAFAGYFPEDQLLDTSVLHDVNMIANLVESGGVVPVELTGINPGTDVRFRQAVSLARGYIHANADQMRSLVDVTRCRLLGIRPLPSLSFERAAGQTPESSEASPDDRPFVAKSSLKGLTLAEREDEHVIGTLDLKDPAPPRVQHWKRSLLDLSMRNPLLNLPRRGKVLDLLTPHGLLPAVDDAAHAGRRIRLRPADGVDEFARQHGLRAANEMAADDVIREFSLNRSLYAMVEASSLSRRMRTLQREARTLEQETGSNYLFLTLGALVHSADRRGGQECRAPLFLMPVRLSGNPVLGYSIEMDDGERAVPNLCLIEWLRVTQGVRLPVLEDPPTDDSGIAMSTVLDALRAQLAHDRLSFRIDETASLALLRFSTFQIWRDLNENWADLMTAPIVEHLVRRPGETFEDPHADQPVVIDEPERRLPIPADGSQLRAITAARAGHTFVLEGPPGTGKSQTITNLIAGLLHDGKTVLFVAEKQAALDVVQRRLDAIGLGPFALQLHGRNQSIGSIREQLKAAFDVPAPPLPATLAADSSRLTGVISELQQYPGRVHDPNDAGLSLWEGYEQASVLGDGPAADVPLSLVRDAGSSAQQARDQAGEFMRQASRVGLTGGEPWLLVGPRFTPDSPGHTPADLEAHLTRLDAALGALSALPPDLTDLLRPLAPGVLLPAAAHLIERQAQGLLAPDILAHPAPPQRFEQLQQVRSSLVGFVQQFHDVLAVATPGLFGAGDLGSLQARSRQLDTARLFVARRRKGLRRRLADLVAPGVAEQIDGDQITTFLDRAIDAAACSAELTRTIAGIQDLRLPGGWSPWAPDAVARFDDAVSTLSAADRIRAVVGAGGLSALLTRPENELAWVREICAAWQEFLRALGSTPVTVAAWSRSMTDTPGSFDQSAVDQPAVAQTASQPAGHDWVSAWQASQQRWHEDLRVQSTRRIERVSACVEPAVALAGLGLPGFAIDLLSATIPATEAVPALLRGLARTAVHERMDAGNLRRFDRTHEDALGVAYNDLSRATRADMLRRVADEAMAAARGAGTRQAGPVHLNLPYREPLAGALPEWLGAPTDRLHAPEPGPDDAPVAAAPEQIPSGALYQGGGGIGESDVPSEPDLDAHVLERGPRTVVVAGADAGAAAESLAHAGGWPLVAEIVSGARFGRNVVHGYRGLLADPELGGRVERAIVFGHPTLSREVTALLSRSDVDVYAVRGPGEPLNLNGRTTAVDAVVAAVGDHDRDWFGGWMRASRAAAVDLAPAAPDARALASTVPTERLGAISAELDVLRAPIDRTALVDAVWRATWPHDRLLFASSRLVRVADEVLPGKKVPVHANRGLAGIDGTVSTALGIAIASQGAGGAGVTRVVIGDLALLHDVGGLLLPGGEAEPRVQVVVGNDGGGTLFDGLEVAQTASAEAMDRVLYTPQSVDIAQLAAAYGWQYRRAATRTELDQALVAAVAGRQLIEVALAR